MKPNKLILLSIIFCLLYIFNVYSPYKIEFIGYYDKVWGHRTNSLEKLNTGLDYFEGVELDLVYDFETNALDVNHPPQKSINLTFNNYISYIIKNGNNRPFLWLDIKNLTCENSEYVLKKLNSIFKKYNYPREKILIESTKPRSLRIFHINNFRTSYYLPNNLYRKEGEDLVKELEIIKENLLYKELEISFDFHNYEIIDKAFPNRVKNTWILSKLNLFKFSVIRKILKDPTVKNVLVRYFSLKGNR